MRALVVRDPATEWAGAIMHPLLTVELVDGATVLPRLEAGGVDAVVAVEGPSATELCRAAKTSPKAAATPFLLVTRLDGLGDVLGAVSAGADDLIATRRPEELAARVVVSVERRRRRALEPFAPPVAAAAHARSLDLLLAALEIAHGRTPRADLVGVPSGDGAGDERAALRWLAASLVNDAANPLTIISANSRAAQERIAEWRRGQEAAATEGTPDATSALMGDVLEMLGDTIEGVSRMEATLRDVSLFAGAELRRRPLELHTVVADACARVARDLRPHARISLELQPVPPFLGDAERLGRAALALVGAAVARSPLDAPDAVRVETREHEGAAQLIVEDAGPRVPAAAATPEGDPFSIARLLGVHADLGLALCQQIILMHEGSVSVQSSDGGRTRILVRLPLRSEADPAETPGAPPPRGRVVPLRDAARDGNGARAKRT